MDSTEESADSPATRRLKQCMRSAYTPRAPLLSHYLTERPTYSPTYSSTQELVQQLTEKSAFTDETATQWLSPRYAQKSACVFDNVDYITQQPTKKSKPRPEPKPTVNTSTAANVDKLSYKLIADTRERNVLRHDLQFVGLNMEVRQITTGDYAVCKGEQLCVVIERKSLEDFAASFKDGRHDNKQKLLAARAETGCSIIYIIEGPEFPKPTDTFGNIPYKHIESSIFHMMVRDGISIIRSKDTLDTAKLLVRFMASMETLEGKSGGRDVKTDKESTVEKPTVEKPTATQILTLRQEKTIPEIVRMQWACFPGITVITADEFMKKWSLREVINGSANIASMKMATGRAVSKKVVAGLSKHNVITVQVKLLSAVPTISSNVAAVLLTEHSLADLLSWGVDGLAMAITKKAPSTQQTRRLGAKKAKRIIECFDYKNVG